jgi:hypothetical protein
MTKIRRWFGYGWATPVTSRPWAFAATVLEWVKRGSGYRVGCHAFGHAWERAVAPR